MRGPAEVFRKYCAENTMRYTPGREMIIDEVCRRKTHFDIDSLFLRIRQRYPGTKLAKGSIYRAIPHLIRAGLIRQSLTDEGRVSYERALGYAHHDHLKCVGCGRVFEFYEAGIDKIQRALCKKRGFRMITHTHVIAGYCGRCRGKGLPK